MAEAVVLRRSSRARKAVSYNDEEDPASPLIRSESTSAAHASCEKIKTEPDEDFSLPSLPTGEEPTIKSTKRNAANTQSIQPPVAKKSRIKKGKTAPPTFPHRLVILPGMRRPPGERQPPMIYRVVKRATPKARMTIFHFNLQRAISKWKPLDPGVEETRLLPYIDHPEEHYFNAAERAATQRMYVLKRERAVEEACHAHHTDCPVEHVVMTGSSGNIYQVTISHKAMCSCPDYIIRKRACKHIVYVLHHVLKVPAHLKHQIAFLTSELREIAKHAPPISDETKQELDGKRKPLDDDCPICCMPFEEGVETVWCKTSCGNSLHKECFQQWAAVRPGQVTCPFCRASWEAKQSVQITNVVMPTVRDQHGFLNVADQLDYN